MTVLLLLSFALCYRGIRRAADGLIEFCGFTLGIIVAYAAIGLAWALTGRLFYELGWIW